MKSKAFLIRVAICFFLSLIPLRELEQRIYSGRMQLRGEWGSAPQVVILDLEPEGFQTLKQRYSPGPSALSGRDPFYWDPAVFREVLRALLGQDPSAVMVSWFIPTEVVESLSDPSLENLAKNRKVLWSSQFDSDGKFLRSARMLSTPNNSGYNNLSVDSDGVIREAELVREGHPSLAQLVYRLIQEKPLTEKQLSRRYLINYVGPAGSIIHCRLLDVLSAAASGACHDLRGKVVILSKEADRESFGGAYFRTPLGEMSRAEILANEIHTLINRKTIYRASWIEQSVITLGLIFLGAFYIMYYPVLISAIAVTGTGIAVVIVLFQLLFHLFGIYIPSAGIGASLLITYLVFTGYRLAFQENLQWRSLKQAQYLRELDQMKTNFLSLVSHDLKTPLAKIQAVVERMRREGALPPEERTDWRELIDSIENSNNELRHYITSILNLSKIESQKVILNKKSHDINRLIQQALKRLRPIAQNKQISIEESLEPLFSIECDEDLLRQVITNILDNAIKYSPTGSKVIVRSREEEGFVRVEVEDFGPGIPKDQLPLMFRKFSRFLRPMKEQVKGTGLGLYLSKYFIELHGGSIRVKSEEGKGTTFSFTLPLQGEERETILG